MDRLAATYTSGRLRNRSRSASRAYERLGRPLGPPVFRMERRDRGDPLGQTLLAALGKTLLTTLLAASRKTLSTTLLAAFRQALFVALAEPLLGPLGDPFQQTLLCLLQVPQRRHLDAAGASRFARLPLVPAGDPLHGAELLAGAAESAANRTALFTSLRADGCRPRRTAGVARTG